MNVSVHGAKTQLSKLLDLVLPRRQGKAALGAMRDQFTMSEGWERPLTDEEAEAFWGGR